MCHRTLFLALIFVYILTSLTFVTHPQGFCSHYYADDTDFISFPPDDSTIKTSSDQSLQDIDTGVSSQAIHSAQH